MRGNSRQYLFVLLCAGLCMLAGGNAASAKDCSDGGTELAADIKAKYKNFDPDPFAKQQSWNVGTWCGSKTIGNKSGARSVKAGECQTAKSGLKGLTYTYGNSETGTMAYHLTKTGKKSKRKMQLIYHCTT